MLDVSDSRDEPQQRSNRKVEGQHKALTSLTVSKRLFDVFVSCLFLLPAFVFSALILFLINPFLNRGPLLLKQPRMGKNCEPFSAYKFRSMLPAEVIERKANDPLEHDRITKLGCVLRKFHIDELPQIINVLRGEMSLIGPRPDYFPHAQAYLETVNGYRERHAVLPGISGLAQTEIGYAQGIEATRRKVLADLYYIKNSGFRLEAWVLWRTLCVVLGRKGL
jgi:lipopolysaccharide/colanic/teichoic acid biosynthesis glycosyltransferase